MRIFRMCLILAVALVLFYPGSRVTAHHGFFPDRIMKMLYPDAERFTSKDFIFTRRQVKYVEKRLGRKLTKEEKIHSFYFAWRQPDTGRDEKQSEEGKKMIKMKRIGILIVVDPMSPDNKRLRAVVGINLEGKIDKYLLLELHEGARFTTGEFQSQFEGKGVDDAFIVGKDVGIAKGMEQESQALATSAKKALLFLFYG